MNEAGQTGSQRQRSWWPWIIGAACWCILLLFLLFREKEEDLLRQGDSKRAGQRDSRAPDPNVAPPLSRAAKAKGTLSAEEIVATKVRQFARSRRDFVYALARRANQDVPNEVEAFFDALEAGDWDKAQALYKGFAARSGQYEGSTHAPELDEIWPAIHDAFGAAEQAHLWPAHKLLDYGNAVLESLRPGMVYVGGTDPGRWIPALMNDTSDGERHIVLTQNALADGRYRSYVEFMYGDRLATLTQAESDRAFAEYIADAQKRFEHDRQFPDEPKQLRPGEDVRMVDGKIQVSGQVSVMGINERLFQMILEKNPELAFAMEESFPFKSVLADASPLGPVMEVRPGNEENALTPQRLSQTVDYWRGVTEQLNSDPDALSSHAVRASYSKLLSSQAGLFEQRNHPAEAEQLLRWANEICPYSPEAVFRYTNLLLDQNRLTDAIPVAEKALQAAPDNQQFKNLLKELQNRTK